MGCGVSAQKDVHSPNVEVMALSTDMKTRFASIDAEKLGPYKEEAKAKLVFMYGRVANIFLLTTPAFHTGNGNSHSEGEEATPAEEEIRWTIFNDSKCEVMVEATFFHAETLRVARANGDSEDVESGVKLERFDGGRVKAEVVLPAGSTVAFVEGPISGFMWKCMVYDSRVERFEPAVAAE